MALPASIDYAAPLADLPDSRAGWTLDRDRAAVLVHDLQRYFVRPYAPGCPALDGAVAATAQILSAARTAGVPVFYTAQNGDQRTEDRGLQGDLWGPGMRAIPEHTDILDAVAPAEGDVVLTKHRYSAFARSDLAARLAASGRDQLVVTGVYAHIGITATAFDAFQREIHPFVVADAVADFGPDQHRRALEQVASCSGVVTLAHQVVEEFALPRDAGAEDWDAVLRTAFDRVLPETSVEAGFTDPEVDLFTLGLDSLRAFEVLDLLADEGVDVDFGDFTRRPTIAFLRERGGVGVLTR
jgi:bifunctional isochorismate lyase / aryl carrier protein